ncbi:DUF4194 domain-containing protein [Konateibacter massiliensis]|uniref:DUF4194 domain-containing protein n=1 Tax=Konateibacter massiliensis TaxID=2002841 RepID=UPI000C160E98|nr:DUF4194 domain-containing protein [Konateibacter massiliensis]
MIPYYRELPEDEQEELTKAIKLLQSQTFVLERKYDKKTARYQYNKEYRICEKHLEFLMEYFKVADIEVVENRQYGVIALRSGHLIGEKLSKLTTIFVLLLKLTFEEKMNSVSNSVHVYTALHEIYDKINLFRLWDNKALPITEVKKTIAVLRKYQIIDLLDFDGEISPETKLIVYPSVNLLISAEEVRNIITQYEESEEEEDDSISGDDENVSEQLALY